MNKGGCKTGRTKESPNGGCKIGKKNPGKKKYKVIRQAKARQANQEPEPEKKKTKFRVVRKAGWRRGHAGVGDYPPVYRVIRNAKVPLTGKMLREHVERQDAEVADFLGGIEQRGFVFNKKRIETDNAINYSAIEMPELEPVRKKKRFDTTILEDERLGIGGYKDYRSDEDEQAEQSEDYGHGQGTPPMSFLERYYAEQAEQSEEELYEDMQYSEVLQNAFGGNEVDLQDPLMVANRILQALRAHLQSLDDDELVEDRGMGTEDPDLLYRNWNNMVMAIDDFDDAYSYNNIDEFIDALNRYSSVFSSSEGSGYWLPDDMGDIFADYWEFAQELGFQYSARTFEGQMIDMPENLTDLVSKLYDENNTDYESD